jgi:DinB family
MNKSLNESLWKQFGASIDMLENAISMCPGELWDTKEKFWYSSYHCLFFLDYYLTLDPSTYRSPKPFTNSEFEGKLPERPYTKDELLMYSKTCKEKCHQLLSSFTDEVANKRWVNQYRDYSVFEMLLYNMRHVQHHTAQLNRFLRQNMNNAPAWVMQTKDDL